MPIQVGAWGKGKNACLCQQAIMYFVTISFLNIRMLGKYWKFEK